MTKELVIKDHTEDINSQVLSQYKNAESFKSFVTSFLSELNELETELISFKTDLILAASTGKNLNGWGLILDSASRPIDDSTFRNNLYALIFAYNSEGRAIDIINLFTQVTTATDIKIREVYDSKFQVHLKEPSASTDYQFLYRAMRLAKPSAVGYLPISTSPLTPTFSFDSDSDPDGLGFSVIGGVDGGYYSILQPEI